MAVVKKISVDQERTSVKKERAAQRPAAGAAMPGRLQRVQKTSNFSTLRGPDCLRGLIYLRFYSYFYLVVVRSCFKDHPVAHLCTDFLKLWLLESYVAGLRAGNPANDKVCYESSFCPITGSEIQTDP